MSTVTLTIDGRKVTVPAGMTVMQAADQVGIHIPRLCYHPQLSIEGACRVCVVEVDGQRNLVASCAFPVSDGMVVRTATPEIRNIRRDIVELILDNHPMDCQTCERDGNCELQRLAYAVGVRERLYEGERKSYRPDTSSPSLVRDPEKCVLCHRCVRLCREIQHVGVLGYYGRGFKTVVMPAYDAPFQETLCATCGQCINVCPTAAFLEKSHTDRVLDALADSSKHVVVQVAPSVRAAIGEGFGMPLGVAQTGRMVAALRLLGFDKVFDTQFSADLTIMEEASELVQRIKNGGLLPLITSCSPGWVKFCEHFFPDFLDNLSTCKSPMSMHSAVVKTYYAEKMGIDPRNIYSVAVMCCVAKKFEAERPELGTPEYPHTDAVITTRELIWMIKSAGINFKELEEEDFDHPLGESSGAGTIFGATGGVMEAALRTGIWMLTGRNPGEVEILPVRGLDGIKTMEAQVDGLTLRCAVAHGLGNAYKLMQAVRSGEMQVDFIEIMGCPGGCVGGGGQPYAGYDAVPLDPRILQARAEALYNQDRGKPKRFSHENPDVQKLYEEFLGHPLSEKSHELLHTFYYRRVPPGIG